MTATLQRPILRSALVNALEGQDLTKKGIGKHLQPGVVTYDEVLGENGEVLQPKVTYLLTLEAIAAMRPTAQGKPVVGKSGNFDHIKVKPGVKYDGVVTDSFWDGESGWESIDFKLDDKKTAEACKKGFQFSCAYIPTKVDETPGKWHNVPYDAVILDGEYTHFAVVPNPRYDGATIELLNSKEPTIMNKVLKAALSLIPLKDLKEVLNSIETDQAEAEKMDKEKKNAEREEKRTAAQQAYDAAMKNASSDEDRAKAKAAFEKANAEIDAPAAADTAAAPTSDLPKQPLGGGDVTPEPGVPGQDGKVGTAATGSAAANSETPEQAQEREKKALEAKNAAEAEEKAKKEAEAKAAEEKKNAEDAAKKKEEDEKKETERVNALKVKEAADKAAAAAREEVLRTERFNSLKALAEERGAGDGLAPVGVVTVQDKENLGRARYGSR